MASKTSLRIWDYLVIFALIYLGSQLIFRYVFPAPKPEDLMPIIFKMQSESVRLGTTPESTIKNNTNAPLTIADHCPWPPYEIYKLDQNEQRTKVTSDRNAVPCLPIAPIAVGKTATVTLAPWKESIFSGTGTYELQLTVPIASSGAVKQGTGTLTGSGQVTSVLSTRFTITEPGMFTKIFRAFITKPIMNALILIASVVPYHDLGLSIILITLLVKLLLFIPTQHALEGQRKMQLLQPKLEEVRRMHGSDAKKMQEETMKLWKEHKVNPFQSCLPLLVQFPILIGLFYVLQEGYHLGLSQHLVYPFYQNINWTFDTQFLGFDLTKSYPWIFPPILVILQFIQMKLTFHISDKKKAKELTEKTTKAVDTPQELQQKMMIYVLPLMIGFFSFSYASALSLYWGISTIFGIVQQLIVNREHIRP